MKIYLVYETHETTVDGITEHQEIYTATTNYRAFKNFEDAKKSVNGKLNKPDEGIEFYYTDEREVRSEEPIYGVSETEVLIDMIREIELN